MYDLTFLFMYKLALKLGPRVQRQLGQFESKYQRPAGEGNWHLLFHLYRFSTGITHWSPTIVKKVNVFRYRASKEGWRQGRNLAEQSLGLQTPGFFGSPCNQGGCVSTKKWMNDQIVKTYSNWWKYVGKRIYRVNMRLVLATIFLSILERGGWRAWKSENEKDFFWREHAGKKLFLLGSARIGGGGS